MLVHVRRDVDTVDHHAVDLAVDHHVDEAHAGDPHARHVDVAERRSVEVDPPEARTAQIPILELFSHGVIIALGCDGAANCRSVDAQAAG